MKNLKLFRCPIILIFFLSFSSSSAQEYTRWHLPEDAIARFGRGWDHTIRLWDVQTGQLLKTFAAQTSGANSGISLSSDRDTLAAATDEHVIRLWNTQTGKIKAILKGHTQAVTSVAFSPNNYLLASGSGDKTIRLWHADTGELPLTFPEQSNRVRSIAFSPDGQTIASGISGTIYMSDLATGKHIATFTGHADRVQSVAFSPDGKLLVSGGNEGTVILWNVMDKDLRDNR